MQICFYIHLIYMKYCLLDIFIRRNNGKAILVVILGDAQFTHANIVNKRIKILIKPDIKHILHNRQTRVRNQETIDKKSGQKHKYVITNEDYRFLTDIFA